MDCKNYYAIKKKLRHKTTILFLFLTSLLWSNPPKLFWTLLWYAELLKRFPQDVLLFQNYVMLYGRDGFKIGRLSGSNHEPLKAASFRGSQQKSGTLSLRRIQHFAGWLEDGAGLHEKEFR